MEPVVTVGDLINGLATAKQAQSTAQTVRDGAALTLTGADATLAAQTAAVASADTAIKQALASVGPVLVNGVVYEPTSDGYRSFTPATADTPVPGFGGSPQDTISTGTGQDTLSGGSGDSVHLSPTS
jgi:hypothetical protein